jgi:hypothetical protein
MGLLIRRPRRGQGSRKMSDGKGSIFMKSSPHSFDNLVRIHHSPPRPQHLFKFDFARIDVLRRHDEPDPEIVQNDDEMRQQPSHDPPDNREQGQDTADQEGGYMERDATERRGRRWSIRQREERKEDEEGDERPTDNPTSGVWSPEHIPLDCRLEVLLYPPKNDAANDEKEAADAEPQAWADQPHNSPCDHSFTPIPNSVSPMNLHFALGSLR